MNPAIHSALAGVTLGTALLIAEMMTKAAIALARAEAVGLVLLLATVAGATRVAGAQEPSHPAAGEWTGYIELPDGRLDIVVSLTRDPAGEWSGRADIPAQGARGVPLGAIAIEDRAVTFQLMAGQGNPTFTGTLSEDAARISGTFTQATASLPFELTRATAAAAAAIPSAPVATPIPAAGEPYNLETATGTLHGTLVLAEQAGPHPVALLIAGSGPTDREGNSAIAGRNDSLALLAEGLAELGISSVRYDKRGLAASAAAGPPSEADLTFETYVDDAAAWVRRLREDGRFSDVVVIGHSEGSLIGMVAAGRAGADAFVSIAGAGRRAPELLREQLRTQLPPDLWNQSERILASLENGQVTSDVPPALAPLYRESVQPYLISWFRYDPAQEIGRLAIPTLIAQGTTDIQVGTADAEALHAARPDAGLVIVDGMNHVLKLVPPDPAAQAASYSDPTLPVAPELIARIGEFILSARR